MINHTMLDDGTSVFYYVVLFVIYSFLGWVIEVIYRSITQRKFVNAGFLYGPFIPLYGIGAAFTIILQYFFHTWHLVPRFIIFGLTLTAIEYSIGFLFEKIFKLTLWDYSEYKFNLQGKVCLLFSTLWTILAFIFITFIHPLVSSNVFTLNVAYIKIAAVIFLIYYSIDSILSLIFLTEFQKKIAYLYTEYFNLSNLEIERILNSFQRLRNAFPDLNRYINENINNKIKNSISAFLKSIQDKIILEMNGRKPFEHEYYEIIQDIDGHEEFMKLKDYFHHNSSIYEHVQKVAYLSYRMCKFLKLDYRSAARGAILHDFFLYDWRNHDVPDLSREKFHGIEHPAIAFANAKKHFSLNEIEEDIIKKHMWPLTLFVPKYKESFIVSFADKYLSSKEFIGEFKKRKSHRKAQKEHRRHNKSRTH
jgi:uncharacterized membrane protein/HD superfamily phosphodiesterase